MDAPEKIDDIAVLNQKAGKILDIQVAQPIGVVLDIDPQKNDIGILARQLLEGRPPAAAGAAPVGAETGDDP